MEQHSQVDASREKGKYLEDQLRVSFGRVTYSHKTQEKCADILLFWSFIIKVTQIVLSAVSSVSIFSTFFGVGVYGSIVGGLLAAILCALNLLTKESNLGEFAQKHRTTASDLWLIRERFLSLLTDLRTGNIALEEIQKERDILLTNLGAIYSVAPSTNSRAYQQARKALKYDEEMTFSEQEIDAFLPNSLKVINGQ